MPKKFVEGDDKIIRNKNTEDVDSGKISKKTKEKFESIIKSFSLNKLLAWCPTILLGGIFIACFFYPGIDTNEVLKNRPVFLVGPISTASGLYLILYNENKYKRLYKQVCDGTIIIKALEIIRFKRYRPRWHLNFKYDSDAYGYRIIVSDGNKKYKSRKYSDRYLGLDSLNNIRIDQNSLKINGKIHYIGDKVTVYIDFEKENNYYVDV